MAGSIRVALTLEQCWHRVPGGTASSILGLVRALQKRSDLDLVGVSAWHRRPADPPWQPSIGVRSLPVPGTLLYDAWHRLRQPAVERATGPVDVIHATTLAIPPASAPLVVTVHDLAFLDHPEFFTMRGLQFFRRGLDLARRHANVVICPSQATAADCLANGFDSERLLVIPWAIDVELADDMTIERVRSQHRLERPYALFVGTIEPRKNLSRLLKAFARALEAGADLDLVIVGPDGWNEELGELVGAAAEEGTGSLHDRVRSLGFVAGADLNAIYAGAAMFCYPSIKEGFGLPVLEAMAQGTPVLTSAGTSTAEVGGDAAVLVDPLDIDQIADGIVRLASGSEEVADRGRRGRQEAKKFTWEAAAEATESAYRQAMG